MTLRSIAIGTIVNDPAYVFCDPFNPGQGTAPYCITLITNETEALEPTPVTVADNSTTRWDFDQFLAGSDDLDLVVDGFPSEFQNIDIYPNSNGLSPDKFSASNFLAVVRDAGGHTLTAGGLTLSSAPAATNDSFSQIIPVTLPFRTFVNTSGAAPLENPITGGEVNPQGDPAPPSPCSPDGTRVFRSVWYSFTGTGNAVTVSTKGSRYDTLIYVFTGSRNNPNSVACNDDGSQSGIGGVESDVTFGTTAGTTYYVMLSETPPDVLTLLDGGGTVAVPLSNDATLNMSIVEGSYAGGLNFVSATPCRLADTRLNHDPIQGGTFRSFPVPQLGCNIPSGAAAYSLNVTVVPHGRLGYLTIWPTGQSQPVVSTMNSPDGRTKANAAIVPSGAQGAVNVYVTDTTDVILDIDGYFTVPGQNTYQFYALPPCRVADTRNPNGHLGGPYLHAQMERDFPVRESSCIPMGADIKAYSMNFTAVPHQSRQPLGYLTVWPAGSDQPFVSTLNNPTGTVVANAAVVPAGVGGGIATYPYNDTDLIIDINGYFAPPAQNGLSLYTAVPCRVYDSRDNNGQPFRGERAVNVVSSPCAPPANGQAYVLNATVVPSGVMGYLTLWPDGQNQPLVSTLNAYDGITTSNMAIVPTANGQIDAYVDGLTHLILDISGYFAP